MISKNSFYSNSLTNSPSQIIKEEKTNHVNSEYLSKSYSYQDISNSLYDTHNKNEQLVETYKNLNFAHNSNQIFSISPEDMNRTKSKNIQPSEFDEFLMNQTKNKTSNEQNLQNHISMSTKRTSDFEDEKEQSDTNPAGLKCVVCGSNANGYNFDAVTCESCKAFFRRNAFRSINLFRCSNNDTCVVNPITRKKCKKCRIMKCFRTGMRRDWIMTDLEREEKRKKIQENRRRKQNPDQSISDQESVNNDLNSSISSNRAPNDGSTLNESFDNSMQRNEDDANSKFPVRRRRRRRRNSSLDKSKSQILLMTADSLSQNSKELNNQDNFKKEIIDLEYEYNNKVTNGHQLPISPYQCHQVSHESQEKRTLYTESKDNTSVNSNNSEYHQQHLSNSYSSENYFYETSSQSQMGHNEQNVSSNIKPLQKRLRNSSFDKTDGSTIINQNKKKVKDSNSFYRTSSNQATDNAVKYSFKKYIIESFAAARQNNNNNNKSPEYESSQRHSPPLPQKSRYRIPIENTRLIEKIRRSYTEAIKLVHAQGLPNKSDDINQTINLTEVAVRRIVNFFKLVVDFKEINHELMIILIKNSMMTLLQVHGVNSYDKINNTFKEPDSNDTPFSADSLETVYGKEVYQLTITITKNLCDINYPDKAHIKLLMLICLFDPYCEDLVGLDRKKVQYHQNKYVKLLYSHLCDSQGLEDGDKSFKAITNEINKIDDLSKWFKTTVDEKSHQEFVRPLMIEIFALNKQKLRPLSWVDNISSDKSSYLSSVESPSPIEWYSGESTTGQASSVESVTSNSGEIRKPSDYF